MICNIISLVLLVILGIPSLYLFVFALASRFAGKAKTATGARNRRFVVLIPAYKSDGFIADTARAAADQDYPRERYRVLVISDSMSAQTVADLPQTGAEVLEVCFERSTKAKSLQKAMEYLGPDAADNVVILDSDNIVENDFLSRLDDVLSAGAEAVQAHRCAKNTDTPVAVIDAVSEEINNSIFRKGHCALGLSSALVGSGMAFPYEWFYDSVKSLATSGEDKEMELALLVEGIFVHYAEDIPVKDEKTRTAENYGKQRRRWMATPLHLAAQASGGFRQAKFKAGYADKLFQWLLPPRMIHLCLLPIMALVVSLLGWSGAVLWWTAFAMLLAALLISLPQQLRGKKLLNALASVPRLALLTFANIFKLKETKDFIHTDHQ